MSDVVGLFGLLVGEEKHRIVTTFWALKSGWWFGTFFIFPLILGIITPIDFHIFQRGGPGPPTRNGGQCPGFTAELSHSTEANHDLETGANIECSDEAGPQFIGCVLEKDMDKHYQP